MRALSTESSCPGAGHGSVLQGGKGSLQAQTAAVAPAITYAFSLRRDARAGQNALWPEIRAVLVTD